MKKFIIRKVAMLNRCDADFEKEKILSKLKSLRKSKLDLDLTIFSLEETKKVWLNHDDTELKNRDLEILNRMKKSSQELGKAIEQLTTRLRS